MKGHLGLIQIFWGDGKGKTTAALGTAVRALGHGFKVHLIQFFKGGSKSDFQEYGELRVLQKCERFSVEQFGISDWIIGEPTPEQRAVGKAALAAAREALSSGEYDLVILDEALYAVQLGVLTSAEVLEALRNKAAHTEAILTGSHRRLPELEAVADLVTEVRKIKHPYDRGITARKGIEY